MASATLISAQGHPLDTSPAAYGALTATPPTSDPAILRQRLAADGYLYLPQALGRDRVRAARRAILQRLVTMGWVDPDRELAAGFPGPSADRSLLSELARATPELRDVLYGSTMITLHERIQGEPVRHFDFTWLRAMRPGRASRPHMDSVFMNRGSSRLLTAWTPLGDIDTALGGLAVLPGSHRLTELVEGYGARDVDTYCEDDTESPGLSRPVWDGALSYDPVALRAELGLPWLTTDFAMGDVMIFTMHTIHVGLDNNADRLRLSCDSRYQPADDPVDERWIGLEPPGHGPDSKRSMIC